MPLVVAALGLLMFGFKMSLSGVWHVERQLDTASAMACPAAACAAGDFFTAVLAVLVAASCTAPFMAQHSCWAFAAPTACALLVFAFLGLGLALPFQMISFVPGRGRSACRNPARGSKLSNNCLRS